MRKHATSEMRKPIRGKGWSAARSIAADKYELISRAILQSLTRTPIPFSEVVRRVSARTESFAGSIPWYTVACLRELEVQGKVVRHRDPVRYSR